MNPYLKESLIGVGSASLAVVVVAALMQGGTSDHFASAILMLVISFAAPILSIPTLPWLVAVYALAGAGLYLQYTRLSHRFLRFLVGAEVVVWLVFGMWCTANILAA